MKTHLLALLSLFCIGTALAQTPRDERIARAVERMDDGDYDEAARLLESVLAADPKNFLANYETGYLLYMQERYEEAVEVLRRIKRKDYPPLYQLLGNAYDMAGDRKRAVKTYEKGLRENPDAGRLYLELGNIAYAERQYDRALACYRRGATVDPAHPSNYRSLALLYAISTEPVWTLVWGELFMNLERGSGRTSAMSETLAQTYRDNIRIEGDTAVRMTFSRNGRVAREGLRLRIPFGTAVFEVAARAALTADGIPDSLTLDVLSDMRERFVDRYFEKYDRMLFDDDAARPLMDYQRQVKDETLQLLGAFTGISRRVPAVAGRTHRTMAGLHRVVRRAPDVRSRPRCRTAEPLNRRRRPASSKRDRRRRKYGPASTL